jgi:ribosomal protein S2
MAKQSAIKVSLFHMKRQYVGVCKLINTPHTYYNIDLKKETNAILTKSKLNIPA